MHVDSLVEYRSVPLNLDQATISPHRGPTYDQEYLKELKASTPTSRPIVASDPYDADMSMDVGDASMMSVETVDVFSKFLAVCTHLGSDLAI